MCAKKLSSSSVEYSEDKINHLTSSFHSNQYNQKQAQHFHHYQQHPQQPDLQHHQHKQHHHHHHRRHSSGRAKPSSDYLEPADAYTIERFSDRLCGSRSEEERRRRTIIIEKEDGSFGFTIQSYAINYKREGEAEVITYVDFVAFGSPAFRAGMREGDVILSVNGHDVERADHHTLVKIIQNCGNRLRMVLSFEDCINKVELHMRYIQLQQLLKEKMNELERLCHQEKSLVSAWRAQGCIIPKQLLSGNAAQYYLPSCPSLHSLNLYGSNSKKNSSSHSNNSSPRRDYWPNAYSASTDSSSRYTPKESCEDLWVERKEKSRVQVPLQSSKVDEKSEGNSSLQWMQQKPRSWDNLLSTRSFGGYGYGYGFMTSSTLKEPVLKGRFRSVSSYQLEKDKFSKNWGEDVSRTIPRSKVKEAHKSTENLMSPLNSTSSCFSCDCLSNSHKPLDACFFAKPKSTESLLAPRSLVAAPSDTSLVVREDRERRRSRGASIVDCLGGGRKDEMTHL